MCGRFAQYRIAYEYLDMIGVQLPFLGGLSPEPIGRYNVAPRSKVLLMHQDEDGLRMEPVPWGYAPFWARGKRPPAINARVETAAASKFFRDIWKTGRAIVPADGWYEWKKHPDDPKLKQPDYIHRANGQPMFFAALGQFQRGDMTEPRDGDGFVIITADSDQGMVDIHDRRPVVLEADQAREWVDQETAPERAEEIVRNLALPVEAFEWFAVDRAVGNVRNEGPHLIEKSPVR